MNAQVDATQAHLNNPILKTTPAAEKLPYFTGATTAATLDLGSIGKQLVTAGTPATALSILGTDARYVIRGAPVAENIQTFGTLIGGAIQINNSAPSLTLNDSDWGYRVLHCNDGLIGFLNNGWGWTFHVDNSGNAWFGGEVRAGDVALNSDPRLKDDIKPISPEGARAVVKNVKGYVYHLKSTGKLSSGVLSTEVASAVPALVSQDEDGFDRVSYMGLIPYLFVALNDAFEKIDRLNVQCNRLQTEVARLTTPAPEAGE